MVLQKVIKNGKKFIKFKGLECEIAPRDIVDKYVKKYEIREDLHSITLDKNEIIAGDKVHISGWFIPQKVGTYDVVLKADREYYIGKLKVKEKVWKEVWEDSWVLAVKQKDITAEKIKDLFANAFKDRARDALWLFADIKYKPADIEVVKEVLRSTQIEQMRYISEYYDCDDFSFALMGAFHSRYDTAKMAIFIVWVWWKEKDKTYAHALNAMTDGKKVLLIEPQSDAIFEVPENWNLILVMG